jgi:hypothetical protein
LETHDLSQEVTEPKFYSKHEDRVSIALNLYYKEFVGLKKLFSSLNIKRPDGRVGNPSPIKKSLKQPHLKNFFPRWTKERS